MTRAWRTIVLAFVATSGSCGEDEEEPSYCESVYACFRDCGSTSSSCEFECAEDPCSSGDNACVQARETSLDYARAWYECEEDGADDCESDARSCRGHDGPYEVIARPE